MKKIFLGFLLLICALPLTGCTKGETFGMFTHNGYSLTTFKNKDISFTEAEAIVAKNSVSASSINETMVTGLDAETVSKLTTKYSEVKIYVTHWDSTTDKSETREHIKNGQDLTKILTANQVEISSGILIKNIFLTNEILKDLEDLNNNYDTTNAPFKSLYSYHKDQDDQFVLRSNDFSEITSDITGGISAKFIQENECLYNTENLITNFQSSFGMQFETLGGTQLHGTVLEVEFVWGLKI